MIVTPIKGLYGRPVANHDGILLMFERRSPMPAVDVPIEAMICFAAPTRYAAGWHDMSPAKQARNPPRVPFLVVRAVTDDDALVEISGFNIAAFYSPRPRAFVSEASREDLRSRFGYGPGWLGAARSPVIVHDDVEAMEPTHAYVAGADLRDGLNRITGLPDLDHVDPAIIAQITRRRARETIPPRRTVDTLTSRRGQRSA